MCRRRVCRSSSFGVSDGGRQFVGEGGRLAEGVLDPIALASELGDQKAGFVGRWVEGGEFRDGSEAGKQGELQGGVDLEGAGDGEQRRVDDPGEAPHPCVQAVDLDGRLLRLAARFMVGGGIP